MFIERFLERHKDDVRGRVLEIYEPTYTERFGGGAVTQSDIVDASNANPRATLIGDLREPGWLPADAFDCVICTQALQAAGDPRGVLRSLAQAMAPGGVLLASFPATSQRSGEAPGFEDLWRFTSDGVRTLFDGSGFAEVDVRAEGNLLACAAFLYGMADHETDPQAFANADPEYELVVTARATLAS